MKFSGYHIYDDENNLRILYENKLWKEEPIDINPKNIELRQFILVDHDKKKDIDLNKVINTPEMLDEYFPLEPEKDPAPFKNFKELWDNRHNVNLFVISLIIDSDLARDNFIQFAQKQNKTIQSFVGPNNGKIGYPDGEYIVVEKIIEDNCPIDRMLRDFICMCIKPKNMLEDFIYSKPNKRC